MIIAVTGANGHVGVNLCNSLINLGHTVRALTHQHKNGLHNIPVEIVAGDILDKTTLPDLVEGADVVFHLAAKISIMGDPDGSVQKVNIEGTRNILDAARRHKVGKLIHFSSIHAICQHPANEILDETRPLVNHNGFSYDRSKAESERLVMETARSGYNALVLSPTAIIGPTDHEPSLIGQAVSDIYNRKIPSLVPGGYNWVDIRDVVNAAINAIEKGRSGEKYLLSGHWHSLKEFSAIVGMIIGKDTVTTVLPMWLARTGLPFITAYSKLSGKKPVYTSESLTIISEGNRMISNLKAQRELDFNPRPLESTIRDFIHWLKETGRIN